MSDRERKSPDGLGGNDKANRELVGGQSQIQLLTERFGAVAAQRYVQRKLAQRRAAGALPAAASQVHRAAEKGTSGGGGALPHLDAIQKSFGSHDVSHVQAHTGGAASESAAAIGAEAFASGNHVVFGGTPSLHTAAHEAAHVVQQRGGVQLKGGVGEGGDPYEQHADAVADKVVRGESAEALLTAPAAGSPASSTGSIQRKITDNANGKEITDFDLDQLSYDQARFLVEQIQELRVWNADAEDIAKIEAVLQRAPVNSASSASSPSLSAPSTKSTRKEEMKSSAALDDAATSKSSSSGDPLARIKSATLTTLKPTPIGSSRPKPVYLFDAEGKPTEKKTAARFMVDTSMTKGELANYQLL
ncbi:MAG TPA: DUF4157 domain-containing protein, partial [Polyangia bacterium]|nr:DUF4157 domain-containing protein [Polyangia bacterium]